MEFIDEEVATYVDTRGGATAVQRKVAEMQSKYQLYEYKMNQSKDSLKEKIPEITKTIQMVKTLKARAADDETMQAHFEMTDVVYTEAEIKPVQRVALWLGANVMVEYSCEEAIALLTENLTTACNSLETVLEDLAWLRDQLNICEVNLNRLHNHLIVERRQEKEAAAKAGGK